MRRAHERQEKSSNHLKDERVLVADPDALALRLHHNVEGGLAGTLRC